MTELKPDPFHGREPNTRLAPPVPDSRLVELSNNSALGAVGQRVDRRVPSGRAMRGYRMADTLGEPLEQLLALWRRSIPSILLVAFITFVAVMGITALSRMEFVSTAQLYLGELGRKAAPPDGRQIELSSGSGGDLASELRVVQSRTLIERAILATGLNVTVQSKGRTAPRYWQWRISKRSPAVLDAGRYDIRPVDTHFQDRGHAPETFFARFTSNSDYEVTRKSDAQVLGVGKLGAPATFGDLVMTLQPGREQQALEGNSYELEVLSLDDAAELVDKKLDVSSSKPVPGVEPSKVVTLQFASESPRAASAFLNELMSQYLAERQGWRIEEATAAQDFVSAQLENTRQTLDRLQRELAEYRSQHRGVVLSSEGDSMIGQMSKYEEQRVAARLQVAALNEAKSVLMRADPPLEAYMAGDRTDPVLTEMIVALGRSRQKLTELKTRFSLAAPDVKEAQFEVEGHLASIRGYVSRRLASAQDNLGTINSIIAQYEGKLRNVPTAELGLAQLEREAEVYTTMYTNLLKRQQESAIQRASTVSANRVLDLADVPSKEASPRLALRLLSAPFGLLLGLIFTLARSAMKGTLQNELDVQVTVGPVPLFASIPTRKVRAKRGVAPQCALASLSEAQALSYVEAFRLLRTNLYASLGTKKGRVLVVTSPIPGDGKTSCVLTLASILAADGKSVLVIDADLRKQSHSDLLGIPVGEDLRSVLHGSRGWLDVARVVQLGEGAFYSIDAGGTAPLELLSGEPMTRFLTDAKLSCDYILLDAPSFPLFADALAFASFADLVISVVRLGHTPQKIALEHMARLSEASQRHALVINGTADQAPRYGGTYNQAMAVRHSLYGVERASFRPPAQAVEEK